MRLRINKVGLEADRFRHLARPSKQCRPIQEEYERVHGILFVCPHCGTEFYAEWHYMNLGYYTESFSSKAPDALVADAWAKTQALENAAQEYAKACLTEVVQVRTMQNCPICSGTLKKIPGFYLELGSFFYYTLADKEHTEIAHRVNHEEYWGYDFLEYGASKVKDDGYDEERERYYKYKSEYFKCRAEQWKEVRHYTGYQGETPHNTREVFPLGSGYEHMSEERKVYYQSEADKLINEKVELLDLPIFEPLPSEKLEAIKNTPNTLKNYVQNLIKLENDIYSLTKHLEHLYAVRLSNEHAVRKEQHMPAGAQEILREVSDAEAVYSAQCAELERAKRTPLKKITICLPDKPVYPALAKPGLFNKKKVAAENERLLESYKVAMETYQQEVEASNKEKERQETEDRNALKRMIAEAEEKVRVAKAALDETEASVKQRIAAASNVPGPAKAFAQITEDEIREAEELLKNLYAARNKLYGYDIVFGKYRDVVALSSFYEYLMAGRCDSLEGAHGAYNIYESEIRANQVIAQLSAVLVSLEKIQKNQYMVYTELKGIHSSLNRLNNTMDRALQSIQSIKANTDSMTDYMETIAQNTDVIAHNTAKTAYYAKINAELTNSLGFMMALS